MADGTLPATADDAWSPVVWPIREDAGRMTPLNRITWSLTVGACLVLAVLLLVAGYLGYGLVAAAVAASAAINLR